MHQSPTIRCLAGCTILIGLVHVYPASAKAAPQITLLTPKPGAAWMAGTDVTVTWSTVDVPDNASVGIQLRDGVDGPGITVGGTTTTGTSGFYAGDGLGTFELPAWIGDSDDYSIQLGTTIGGVQARSELVGPLTVMGSGPIKRIELASPAPGARWRAGTNKIVAWTATGLTDAVVAITVSGPAASALISNSFLSAADGYIIWPIPPNMGNATDYRVAITARDSAIRGTKQVSLIDTSTEFEIFGSTARPVLQLTTPVGGETFIGGESRQVCWSGDVPNDAPVNAALLGPTTAQSVAVGFAEASSSCLDYDVCPYLSGDTFSMRLSTSLANGLGIVDRTDVPISITPTAAPPTVEVLSPNGGEVFMTGDQVLATWSLNGLAEDVPLNFLLIAENPDYGEIQQFQFGNRPEPGVLEFYACPFLGVEGRYRLAICASPTGCPRVCDVSDAPFDITPIPTSATIEIISPAPGEQWTVGVDHTIEWASDNTSRFTEVRIARGLSTSGSSLGTFSPEAHSTVWRPTEQFIGGTNQALVELTRSGCPLLQARGGFFTVKAIDCPCGDFDADSYATLFDVPILNNCMAQPPSSSEGCICADTNGDGTIDLRDFAIFANAFGQSSNAVPPDCP